MRIIGALLTLSLLALPAMAVQTVNYGWEDGTSTILGYYGNVASPTNVTSPVNTGSHALQVTESPNSGTPQVYLAFITNLSDGDQVTASFYAYDDSAGEDPSMRIWAHYADPTDINVYKGSTSEGSTYSSGTGWEKLEHTWTFVADGGASYGMRSAMVIELRLYSPTGTTPNFVIDDLSVTAPDAAAIQTPLGGLPPAVADDLALTFVNTDVDITLTANGDNGPFTFEVLAAPANGDLIDNGSTIGTYPHTLSGDDVTYRPNTGWSGLDTFEYQATDTTPTTSDSATIEVGVQTDEVAISEVMHSPTIGYAQPIGNTYQYIEIYNYSGSAVQLTRLDNYGGGSVDTTDNLISGGPVSIGAGEMKIIAMTSNGVYDEEFRCSWSLPESSIIRIPESQYEYVTSSSRMLLFGAGGVLLDAVNFNQDGISTSCSGISVGFDSWSGFDAPDTELNDLAASWACIDTLYETTVTSAKGDIGNPGLIPAVGNLFTPAECYGACCLPDGSCIEGVTEGGCLVDNCGTSFALDEDCASQTCVAVEEKKCCLPIGQCVDKGECECIQMGGLWDGETDCTTDPTCDVLVDIVFNEIDYDQPGSDEGEFIELYGTPSTSLDGWVVEFHNGNASTSGFTLDQTVDLGLEMATMPVDGYLVLGDASAANLDIQLTKTIQNGGCGANGCGDGAVLLYNGFVVEGFSWGSGTNGFYVRGGDADGVFLADIAIEDSAVFPDYAIQKIADGGVWTGTYNNTPGATNQDLGPQGACCDGETCTITYEASCAGTYKGDGVDCDPNPCIPRGACCLPDGSCEEELTVEECDALSGSWNGDGTVCPDYDAFEACLAGPDAGLGMDCDVWDYDADMDVDLADFAVFQANICIPDPIGACCRPDGACEETYQATCENVYFGTYRGDGVACAGLDPACEQPEPAAVLINEVWSNDAGVDDNEYVELYNPNGSAVDLSSFSLIIVDGDTYGDVMNNNYRAVKQKLDFATLGTLPAGGFLTIGTSADAGFTPDVAWESILDGNYGYADANTNGLPDNIQNGSQTYVICPTVAVITTNGVLTDAGMAAVAANQIDAVATRDYDVDDHAYFLAPVVQSEGGGVFGFAQRIPNGTDTNVVADWEALDANELGEMGSATDPSTPSATNSSYTLITGACCDGVSCSVVTEDACVSGGGEFLGRGTDCGPPNPCECLTVAEAKAMTDGTPVYLCDVVVSSDTDLISSSSGSTIHIQDATGGFTVYGSTANIDALLTELSLGDQVDITGVTDSYNGLAEFVAPFSVLNNDGAVGVPAATVVTVADLQDGAANAEAYESMLIRLECVQFVETGTFAYGNYHVWTGSGNQALVRIATNDIDLIGTAIPTGSVNITGILSQFDSSSPYDGGYQLMPRSTADIAACAK